MARTQAADYDKKRAAITDAAARLFARKSFAGASISDIAAECGYSKSLIYHYYDSKDAILFDVMNSHMELLLEAVEETAGASAPNAQTFRAFAAALLKRYVGAASYQKVLLYELENLPKAARREIVAKQRRIIESAEAILIGADSKWSKNRARLRAGVMLFFGMLNWTHTWFRPSGEISRDELAAMAADAMLRG